MPAITPGRALFAAVLVVEVGLAWASRSPRRRAASAARGAVFLLPLALALALRAWRAFSVPGILDWDETYYLSAAVTAASGRGLYPYVVGYGPMLILGGFGYVGYLYALAVLVAGPTLIALRAVSFAASLAALAGLWRLTRSWYGTDAAWATIALVSWSSLFQLTNTARMDSVTFAWVCWALALFAYAFPRRDARWPHVAAGLAFGLGLQAHPDLVVTALGCGLVYAGAFVLRSNRPARPMIMFLAGWCAGLAVFIVANVLPDPHAFYATTMLVRADAARWYASGTASVVASFADPRILAAKEATRYGLLASVVPPVEMLLAALTAAAMLWRRLPGDRVLLALVPAVLAAAAVLLNNASPLYFLHCAPVLLAPAGALFGVGFLRSPRHTMATPALVAFSAAIAALAGSNYGRLTTRPLPDTRQEATASAFAQRVRAIADRRCKVAGDAALYARHFADYPYFVSTRPTEVGYAMRYMGETSEVAYWMRTHPDVVASDEPLRPGLAAYVSSEGLVERAPGVWATPDVCRGETGRGS